MRLLPSAQTIVDDFPQSPGWYRLLIRCRFLLAGIYGVSLASAVGWILLVWNNPTSGDFVRLAIIAAILFAGQAMLLAGAPRLRIRRPTHRRHIAVSLISGAFVAALLSFGFLATATSLVDQPISSLTSLFGEPYGWMFLLIGIPWLFWLIVFAVLWASRWTTGFGNMYRLLVAGTFAEVLATVPVDIYVRSRTKCYCEEGTFWALIIGATAALWTFGPGVALLFLSVRLQRRQRRGVCQQCGYDLRGLLEPRCPECGTAFADRK